MDIDRNGVVWTVLASGHLASFDRRKCKGPLNGPTATGQQCPEGWTLYPFPGPSFKGTESGRARCELLQLGGSVRHVRSGQERSHRHGQRVGFAAGAVRQPPASSSRCAFPIRWAFIAKSMDGRIDDPNAGWKGKGLWSTYATRAPQHIEGGKGTTSKVVKFQIRPDPLAD